MADTKEIALQFANRDGLSRCLEILTTEKPHTFFALPGKDCIIFREDDLAWFKKKLSEEDVSFKEISVVSASDIDQKRIAELRSQRGKPLLKEYENLDWKRQRIEELKKKLDR